ncbi:Origin recognition complex winged helix C-terminal [Phytophthora infestans]|uniref:Origin recognition complex winged helix C-terminal n=1 Tax=Phytophthora infestans TaxID=4787 RepID=A0A833SL50_PHYIN|nr:Origin recognition complex winged helix C-terminal [Phytophthora infestans]
METAAFSTGVSIQYPTGRSAASITSKHPNERVQYPFPCPAVSKTSSERQYRADTETYSVCQELAYHFACEKTRRAVQELLRKSNDTSYSHVLRFFEKYCTRDEAIAEAKESTTRSASPSGRRLRDPNASVIFPELHAFPTAAVIAGTDATSSDLWIEPLTHKLRRTFPLCIKVQRDVATARRFVEWLAARLAKIKATKQREEKYLAGLVEKFDLLPLDQPPVAVGSVGHRITRHQRAKPPGDTEDTQDDEKDKDYHSDDSFLSSSESENSDDDLDFGEKKGKKTRRKKHVSVVYSRWTMTKLLTTIQRDIDELLSPHNGDTSRELLAMLDELVLDRLQQALTLVRMFHPKDDEMVMQSIACLDEAVTWLQHKIVACRDVAVKMLNVAPATSSASVHIGNSEMSLAKILQRVYLQYTALLREWPLDRESINDRRESVKKEMLKHESYYVLKSDDTASCAQPFMVLCIEQLEAFSQQVFGDFLEIWTHFTRENRQFKATSCTLGFVLGVASATSPALRRLDLTVTNRLELQFFSLVDSRKCFDDVLESLVVKAKLPLALTGQVLRAIASRHRRLPSVPRLLLALRFLLFTHFRRCPWSFLALAIDDLGESPIVAAAEMTPLPQRLSIWLKRQRRRSIHAQDRSEKSSLSSWLALCSDLELADLASRVTVTDTVTEDPDWVTVLETALVKERRRQAQWRLGWECFRSSCSWLDVRIDSNVNDLDKQEDVAVTHLALALEGRLGKSPRFTEVLRRLQTCDWVVLIGMIQHWKVSFRVFGSLEDDAMETTLNELATLCAYARTEKTSAKMLLALREEIVTVFTTSLISVLLHPPASASMSRADKLVASWSTLKDATVLDERLRFEYHDHLRNALQDAGIGENTAENSWVHDVGLAFLFYQESASASLSLGEWFESFSSELEEETNSKKKTADFRDDPAIKARFVRAICTLRHWGFIKSDAPRDSEQDFIEKLVFI